MAKSKQFALRALELDDTLAEAHTALALVKLLYDWDWEGARRDLEKAQDLNPSYAYAHVINSLRLSVTGKLHEALAEAELALKLDPLSVQRRLQVGRAYQLLGHDATAMQYYEEAVKLDPSHHRAHFWVGMLYCHEGKARKAFEALDRARALSPDDPLVFSHTGYCHALLGQRAEALSFLTELETQSRNEYVSPIRFAVIHVGLGETEEALDWLEKAYEVRALGLVYVASDHEFSPLRSNPRFQNLLARMGLPQPQ